VTDRAPIVRVLYLPDGKSKDLHGRGLGYDWDLAKVVDAEGECWVTTDSVHCSEYGELFPVTGVGIARLMAYAVNRVWQESTNEEWSELLAALDGPPPPPPPRPLRKCSVCGLLINGPSVWTAGKDYHTACWS
jgi:hypothetical protein